MKFSAEVNEGGVLVLAIDLRGFDFVTIRRLVKAVSQLVDQAYPVPTWSDEAAVAAWLAPMVPSAATAISSATQLLSATVPPGPRPKPPIPGV